LLAGRIAGQGGRVDLPAMGFNQYNVRRRGAVLFFVFTGISRALCALAWNGLAQSCSFSRVQPALESARLSRSVLENSNWALFDRLQSFLPTFTGIRRSVKKRRLAATKFCDSVGRTSWSDAHYNPNLSRERPDFSLEPPCEWTLSC